MIKTTRLKLSTKFAYGFGAVAFGVKNNGFDYFLLLFYSQVMGVDAPLVGLALLIALIFDAFSDPIVGYLSDNTHSGGGADIPGCMHLQYRLRFVITCYGYRLPD